MVQVHLTTNHSTIFGKPSKLCYTIVLDYEIFFKRKNPRNMVYITENADYYNTSAAEMVLLTNFH